MLEFNGCDVLFKCILLASIETSCWTTQNVEWCDVLVFTNDFLQCLYSTTYKAGKWCRGNPGPTIFDVIDPTRTICADYSQGNEALFGENAGKQCVAMLLTAIIYHHIGDISLWISSTLNILTIGNNLYTSIWCSVQTNDYLLLTDAPCIVSIYNKVYTLQYTESLTGSSFMTSSNGPYMSSKFSDRSVFKSST